MKITRVLITVAVLVVCTACAGAVAAPAPAPTLVPIPTPVENPDPAWSAMCTNLRENVRVCLTDSWRFEARLLTGSVVSTTFYWVGIDPVRTHTVEATEEVRRGSEAEYKVFLFDSTKNLTRFDRVVVHVEVESQKFEFGFPIEVCSPPVLGSSA